VALGHQYLHSTAVITHTDMVAALMIGVVTVSVLLCHVLYASEVVWSIKTIVIDWLLCTSLLVILSVVDALKGKQYLVLAVAYFCASNIFSVMVMKVCEALMMWRSPGAPCARYIHNLSIPISVLPSLHAGQLLAVAWALVLILWSKAVDPMISPGVAGWHVMAVSGLWGSLFCYVCPIVANKHPTPYLPSPHPRPASTGRLQQQS